MSATSRLCRARGIWRTTRHTNKRAALYTAADSRPTNQVSAWQAEWGSRPTRGSSRGCRACRRGRHEDATKKLLPWNSGLTNKGSWQVQQCVMHGVITNKLTALDESSAWRRRRPAVSEYKTYSESRVEVYRDDQLISSTYNGVRLGQCQFTYLHTYIFIYLLTQMTECSVLTWHRHAIGQRRRFNSHRQI